MENIDVPVGPMIPFIEGQHLPVRQPTAVEVAEEQMNRINAMYDRGEISELARRKLAEIAQLPAYVDDDMWEEKDEDEEE